MGETTLEQKLMTIQTTLKAPKGQFNTFGKYSYRSCEDILEALKPILAEVGAVVLMSDEVVQIGDRYYIKAVAEIRDTATNRSINNSAFAREDENKKGMDLAQVTGSVSSYARKYALNGLFAIDDTKESDSTNQHGKGETQTGDSTVSDAQLKRLYAISGGNKVPKEEIQDQLKALGKASSKELNRKEYDKLIKFVENYGQA